MNDVNEYLLNRKGTHDTLRIGQHFIKIKLTIHRYIALHPSKQKQKNLKNDKEQSQLIKTLSFIF